MPSDDDLHREFLLTALRAASLRAKLMAADVESIGVALKGDLISNETAVRWIMESGLLWIVGALPDGVGKVEGNGHGNKSRPCGDDNYNFEPETSHVELARAG